MVKCAIDMVIEEYVREVYVQTTFLTYHQFDKYGDSCDTL